MAVGVVVHDALAVEHLDQRLEPQVAGGQLLRVAARRARSSARYSWALTNCSRTSAADLPRVPGNGGSRRRVGAVGHLHAAGRSPSASADAAGRRSTLAVAQLEVDGLAATAGGPSRA